MEYALVREVFLVFAKALAKEGVSHLFTLCDGHIQHIYAGCLDEGIRIVDFRHEQSAEGRSARATWYHEYSL